jgi:hypothetical protein
MRHVTSESEKNYMIDFIFGRFENEDRKLSAQADEADGLNAMARFSRGNIPVQFGDAEDIDELERARAQVAEISLP